MEVRGRNLAEGVPNTLNISSQEIYEAISGPLSSILQSIRNALEQSPPELSSDISERGIVLTGGGALLRDLDKMISEQTGIPVIVAEEPLTCVARGGGIALDILDKYDVDLLSTE
jgi:rod shape-determining protein MreB